MKAEMEKPGAESGLGDWLDRRYQVTPLLEFLRHKEVPFGRHSMVWYYLGGTTLFFFIVQVITGALLLMYYQPGEATAYESIRFVTTKVPFGWVMRSMHSWSAHLMIVSLVFAVGQQETLNHWLAGVDDPISVEIEEPLDQHGFTIGQAPA